MHWSPAHKENAKVLLRGGTLLAAREYNTCPALDAGNSCYAIACLTDAVINRGLLYSSLIEINHASLHTFPPNTNVLPI